MTQIVDRLYATAKQRRSQEADQNLVQQFTAAFGAHRAHELLEIAICDRKGVRAARNTDQSDRPPQRR